MKPESTGKNFIGFQRSAEGTEWFHAVDPSTGSLIENKYWNAVPSEVEKAMEKAHVAFSIFSRMAGSQRASFLEDIALNIESLGDELVQTAVRETGLPSGRISGERGRTTNQIRMFADLIREGSWAEASIDTAIPERQPAPKPDLRKMLRPIGLVVVFGSSNFPLAFSVAGGDTISALAAGNPVVVKAHPAHPGTSELVADCIIRAAIENRMPEGTFSMLFDSGFTVGQSLVVHPFSQAVGFTGSFAGGMALYKLAQTRPDPIPVFAEMGSVNPVFVLPGACGSKGETIAASLAASVNLGAGQFCTNPGLIFIVRDDSSAKFLNQLALEFEKTAPQTMLTNGIADTYLKKSEVTLKFPEVHTLSTSGQEPSVNQGRPLVATVSGDDFKTNPKLAEEVFGPFSLVVLCKDPGQLESLAASISGQLTASVFHDPGRDTVMLEKLTWILSQKAGRIIYNSVPTGVEVCPSMHHGGPFPASTDSRFTSVGTSAIKRFVRPVAYQDCPEALLPPELQSDNPLKIIRLVNGKYSTK